MFQSNLTCTQTHKHVALPVGGGLVRPHTDHLWYHLHPDWPAAAVTAWKR